MLSAGLPSYPGPARGLAIAALISAALAVASALTAQVLTPTGKLAGAANLSDEVRAAGGGAPCTGRAEQGNARTGGQLVGVASESNGVHAAVGYALLRGMR